MNSRNPLSVIAIALALAGPAACWRRKRQPLDKWQSVAKTDNQEAFVNGSSIVAVGEQLEARVKQNFALPQPVREEGQDLPVVAHDVSLRLRPAAHRR